jgi:hypothetical protein
MARRDEPASCATIEHCDLVLDVVKALRRQVRKISHAL